MHERLGLSSCTVPRRGRCRATRLLVRHATQQQRAAPRPPHQEAVHGLPLGTGAALCRRVTRTRRACFPCRAGSLSARRSATFWACSRRHWRSVLRPFFPQQMRPW